MKKIITVVITAMAIMQAMAATRFVMPIAAGTGDGSSWATATTDLQGMIDSSAYGDTVWVAAGKYSPTTDINGNANPTDPRSKTFFLKSGVKIYGGFNGSEVSLAERNLNRIINDSTVLSGDIGVLGDTADNTYHVVFAAFCDSTTVLDGFIISDGIANGLGSDFVQSHNINQSWGGGMTVEYSSITISNCIFSNNYTASLGGGLFSTRSSLTITGCIFAYNTSVDQGGGWDNEFVSTSNISNCVFYGNQAATGGGILNEIGAVLHVTNCTFNHNTASSAGGGLSADSSTLVNCIVWGNTPGPDITRASYSIIEGATVFAGAGNTNDDPRFTGNLSPVGQDQVWRTADDGLQVLSCSPAVDMGITTGAPVQDITGINRYDVPGVGISTGDMGAYENLYNKAIASFSIQGDTLTADSAAVTYQWLACPAETAAPGNSLSRIYIAPATGTYQLAITDGLCTDTSACTQVGPSGINSLTGNAALVVYPDPASNFIIVNHGAGNDATVTIYDILGQMVYNKKQAQGAGIDINFLPAGTYFIATGGKVARFLVQR